MSMKPCQVPGCPHTTDNEICKAHWRRVPGHLKRQAMTYGVNRTPVYYEIIAAAIDAVRNVRNVA